MNRGVYEHKGTEEMNKLANKLVFSYGDESYSEDTEIAKGLALVTVQEKGKRPLVQEKTSPSSEKKRVKRVKVSKEPSFLDPRTFISKHHDNQRRSNYYSVYY